MKLYLHLVIRYLFSKRGVLLISLMITTVCSVLLLQPNGADPRLMAIETSLETFDFMQKQRSRLLPPRTEPIPVEPNPQWCLFTPKLPENYQNSTKTEWQEVVGRRRETFLFTAYYDQRLTTRFKDSKAVVRVLGMVEKAIDEPLYCQLWSKNVLTDIVESQTQEIWERAWDPRSDFYTSVLISCSLPTDSAIPTHISLTNSPCETASNLLPVSYNRPKATSLPTDHNNVVVCVKGMDFTDDLSVRLIEWLEATLMFGADKVAMYTYAVHPNVSKVLKLYEQSGRLELTQLSLPGRMPNIPLIRTNYIQRNRQQKRRNELIPYNDCLYKHLYTHRFLLIIDIDELIVPLKHDNYSQLLDRLLSDNPSEDWTALSVSNAFFFANLSQGKIDPLTTFPNNIAKNVYMLTHPYRSKAISPPGSYGKSFMFIPNLVSVFNHFPLHRIRAGLRKTVFVATSFAIKQHYKSTCPIESREECPDLYRHTLMDDSLLKHKDRLLPRISGVLKQLKWI